MSSDVHELVPEPSVNGADDQETVAAAAEFCRVLTDNPVMLLDMLISALRLARTAAEAKPHPFYFVLSPDAEETTVAICNSRDEMLTAWRAAYQQPGQAFGFEGRIYLPSKGGHYVVSPEGERYPLFAEDHNAEVDPHGYLGPAPAIKAAAAAAPHAAVVPDEEEETPPDEGDEGDVDDDVDPDDEEVDEDAEDD